MKLMIVLCILFMLFFSLSAEINNNDKPEKGTLDLKLEKIWEVEIAGTEPLASVRGVTVSDDGTVYIHDNKNLRFYIFSPDGKFKSAFGKKGEGPGEVRNMLQSDLMPAGDKIVAIDNGRFHYFDKNGKYNRSFQFPGQKSPFFFLNEHNYITAPLSIQDAAGKPAKIIIFNVEKKTETEIVQFIPRDETAVQAAGGATARVQHPAVTPMVIIGRDDNTLFYGVNDKYKINICNLKGDHSGSFTLERGHRKLTYQVKFDVMWRVGKGRAPRKMVEELARKMSSDVNYFDKIEVNNGLIYVYNCYYDRKNIQTIDIFSPEGKYLYRTAVKIPEDQKLTVEPVYHSGYFYLTIEDEDGNQSVGKYKVTNHIGDRMKRR